MHPCYYSNAASRRVTQHGNPRASDMEEGMKLAKLTADIGLSTNRAADHLDFWSRQIGLSFEARLTISATQVQHRFHLNGSILKINSFDDPLPTGQQGGYREVIVARENLAAPLLLQGPDDTRVRLVPPGFEGVHQIGIRLAVRNLAAHCDFYSTCLGLPEERPGRFRAGETLFLLEEESQANPHAERAGAGWRYVTFQVFKADEAHKHALGNGASEARAPSTLDDVAHFSIIRDPDGNAIELSQRASIVGSLK
jgi:predicted enzyme related to lactoylglutathione lyase